MKPESLTGWQKGVKDQFTQALTRHVSFSGAFTLPKHKESPMSALQNFVALLARLVLSPLFIFGGVNHLFHWNGLVAGMTSKGMGMESVFGSSSPMVVQVLLGGATAFLILGGLSLLLGFHARWGAVLLIVFLIPAALIFHDYWHYDGQIQQLQMTNFMKNITIAGGLLMVVAFGPGAWSVDGQRRKRKTALPTADPKSQISNP
jgi:putative oxidoreductase